MSSSDSSLLLPQEGCVVSRVGTANKVAGACKAVTSLLQVSFRFRITAAVDLHVTEVAQDSTCNHSNKTKHVLHQQMQFGHQNRLDTVKPVLRDHCHGGSPVLRVRMFLAEGPTLQWNSTSHQRPHWETTFLWPMRESFKTMQVSLYTSRVTVQYITTVSLRVDNYILAYHWYIMVSAN